MELKMKQLREARNLSQADVAAAINVPVRRYGSWERGERNMNLEDAAMIADVLECSLDDLAGRIWPSSSIHLSSEELDLIDNYRSSTPERKRLLSLTAQDSAVISKETTKCYSSMAKGIA